MGKESVATAGAHTPTPSRLRRILGAVAFSSASVLAPLAGSAVASSRSLTSSLPRCPSTATWPVAPVSTAVKNALNTYYSARHLKPITIYRNRMWVLNVTLERVGTHWCQNEGGGRSGYVGVVPKNATAAVLVQVTHRPYPVTRSATTFATVAKLPKGWKVISDDTGP